MNGLTASTRVLVVLLIAWTATPCAMCGPRSDAGRTVKGDGIIDRVIVAGAEPVFRADGYTFRITAATSVRFGKGLQALSEVGTNTYAIFEGRPDGSGVMIASKAAFARLKLPKRKRDTNAVQLTALPAGSKIDGYRGLGSGSKPFPPEDRGGWCGWYDGYDNAVEQEHVQRVGAKLVPQYQRDLADDDPTKIPFRFYVVEEKGIRSAIFCGSGLVLVPAEVLRRIENEAQLAAVLADGIAGELQLQAEEGRAYTLKDAAELAAGFVPGLTASIPLMLGSAGGLAALSKGERTMEEQARGRMALALMSDAEFDPRQAPEAWRLLAPRQLPKDPGS